MTMNSIDKTARWAGFLYLIFAIFSVLSFVNPSALIVSGDATATANNIAASEFWFRLSILNGIVTQLLFIAVVLVLYRLFYEIDPTLALLMVVLVVMGATATFVNSFNRIAALIITGRADFLSVIDRPQLDALAYAFIRLHSEGVQAIQMFWGLWLFPFGLLVIKSRFIPKWLGVSLIVAGIPYLLIGLVSVLAPQYRGLVSQFTMPLAVGELPIIFWLLFKGAGVQQPAPRQAS